MCAYAENRNAQTLGTVMYVQPRGPACVRYDALAQLVSYLQHLRTLFDLTVAYLPLES